MTRLNIAVATAVLLLVAGPAHATDPAEIPWTPRGLVGTVVHVVEPMSGDLYVGAADGLHILDLQSGTWLPLAREDVAGWPVTAVGRSPHRADRVITGRVDNDGLGAIALTSLADGATEVRLGGLPGPLSKVDFNDYFDDYRLWACAPGVGVAGVALQSGDNGDSWIPLSGHGLGHPHGLDSITEYGTAWPPLVRLYLAGDAGVTWSNDHGVTWTADGDGLPTATVNDLLIEEADATGVPDKAEWPTFEFAATDAGLYFRCGSTVTWRSILADPCRKVCFTVGPASNVGRVYVLTSDRRLLSAAVDTTGADAWVDWSASLGDVVITDFNALFTFLAVGTEADGVFTKAWQQSSAADLPAASNLDLRTAPNPFNPATTLSFQAPTAGPARLAIYDLQGRLVEVLLDGDVAAGPVQREWRPSGQASGVFMARLECGGAVATKRLALVR
ncbi:MAG: T9SS type A sorting domain-containing protein [bacterium]|nr:T9SS type A sorting domain-containing protein [bacterium]